MPQRARDVTPHGRDVVPHDREVASQSSGAPLLPGGDRRDVGSVAGVGPQHAEVPTDAREAPRRRRREDHRDQSDEQGEAGQQEQLRRGRVHPGRLVRREQPGGGRPGDGTRPPVLPRGAPGPTTYADGMGRRQVVQAVVAAALLAFAAFVGSALHTDRTAPQPISFGSDGTAAMVVIGAGGLRASDVDRTATPALWSLLRDGSSASLNVTTVHRTTCPVDGWLTLSAGGRAAQPDAAARAGACTVPAVASGRVTGWSAYAAAAASRPFGTTPGTLAAVAASRGQCLSAIGPGAAIAAADRTGAVAHYHPFGTELTAGLVECSTAIVDVGAIEPADAAGPNGGADSTDGAARAAAVAAVDARVAGVLAATPSGADVIVAGLSDAGTPRLRLLLAGGPRFGPGTLWSPSTRQAGLTQLDDVAATVVAHLGATAPDSFGGAVLQRSPAVSNAEVYASSRQSALVDDDESSYHVSGVVEPFFTAWGAVVVLALGLLAVVWWRRLGSPGDRRRLRVIVRQGLVVAAAVPAATFLANIVPWWRFVWPAAALVAATLLWTAIIGAVALRGAWRRTPTGPPTAVALATVVVLGADVVGGSRLQVASLLGLNPIVGGRFYGMGNVTFALFAAAVFVVAITLAARLSGRPRIAAAAVTVLGLAAIAVDAAPSWGSDAGGPPALVPGLAVLVLAVLGVAFRWRRAAAVLGATVVVVLGIALLDWARGPQSRTHLGRYVQTVLDGGGGDVIIRKLQQNLDTLTGTSVFAYLVPLVLLVFWWLLLKPDAPVARPLRPLFAAVPTMRAGLLGLSLTTTIGLLLNDTGVAIPPIAWMLAVPLVVATALRVAELHDRTTTAATRRERWHS